MPPSVGLSYLHLLIFILVPGYVSLRAYLEGNLVLDDQSRTDKFIVIIIGGFVSLFLTVLLHRINAVGWVLLPYHWATTSAPHSTLVPFNHPVMIDGQNDISVLATAGVLLVESAFGAVLGFTYGRLKLPPTNREEASRRELRQPWEEAFKYATLDTDATVITTSGDEIHGTIEQLGSPSEDYDILLSDPHRVIRAPSGEEMRRNKLGMHSYHHYRDISRVEFESSFDYPEENKDFKDRIAERVEAELYWLDGRTRFDLPVDRLVWWSEEEETDEVLTEEAGGEVTSLSMSGTDETNSDSD